MKMKTIWNGKKTLPFPDWSTHVLFTMFLVFLMEYLDFIEVPLSVVKSDAFLDKIPNPITQEYGKQYQTKQRI